MGRANRFCEIWRIKGMVGVCENDECWMLECWSIGVWKYPSLDWNRFVSSLLLHTFLPFAYRDVIIPCFRRMVRSRGRLPYSDVRLDPAGRTRIAKWGSIRIVTRHQNPGKRHWRISGKPSCKKTTIVFGSLKGVPILRLIGAVILSLTEVE